MSKTVNSYWCLSLKGNQKPKEELPEGVNMYSNAVPNTNSGNYGNKVKSELGVKMQKLEHQFFGGQRKRKLGSEMVCYWCGFLLGYLRSNILLRNHDYCNSVILYLYRPSFLYSSIYNIIIIVLFVMHRVQYVILWIRRWTAHLLG